MPRTHRGALLLPRRRRGASRAAHRLRMAVRPARLRLGRAEQCVDVILPRRAVRLKDLPDVIAARPVDAHGVGVGVIKLDTREGVVLERVVEGERPDQLMEHGRFREGVRMSWKAMEKIPVAAAKGWLLVIEQD